MTRKSFSLSKRELKRQARHLPPTGPASPDRPKTRGECAAIARPCPFVSCRYNLFIDVRSNGTIKWNRGDAVESLLDSHASCALDVAADGPKTLDYVADLLQLDKERVRQITEISIERLKAVFRQLKLDPGQLDMNDEAYVQAPAHEALEQLTLGEDTEWLIKVCNRMDVHGENWKL